MVIDECVGFAFMGDAMTSDEELLVAISAAELRINTLLMQLLADGVQPRMMAAPLAHALGSMMAAAPPSKDIELTRSLLAVVLDARAGARRVMADITAAG